MIEIKFKLPKINPRNNSSISTTNQSMDTKDESVMSKKRKNSLKMYPGSMFHQQNYLAHVYKKKIEEQNPKKKKSKKKKAKLDKQRSISMPPIQRQQTNQEIINQIVHGNAKGKEPEKTPEKKVPHYMIMTARQRQQVQDREQRLKEIEEEIMRKNKPLKKINLTELWSKKDEDGNIIEKEEPHYLAMTARGKQAIIMKQQEEEEVKAEEKRKILREKRAKSNKDRVTELWRQDKDKDLYYQKPVELPHYMQTTTLLVNRKKEQEELLRRNRAKTPRVYKKRDNRAAWEKQMQEQDEPKKQKELPQYMRPTKAMMQQKIDEEEEKQEQEKQEKFKQMLAEEQQEKLKKLEDDRNK